MIKNLLMIFLFSWSSFVYSQASIKSYMKGMVEYNLVYNYLNQIKGNSAEENRKVENYLMNYLSEMEKTKENDERKKIILNLIKKNKESRRRLLLKKSKKTAQKQKNPALQKKKKPIIRRNRINGSLVREEASNSIFSRNECFPKTIPNSNYKEKNSLTCQL